MEEEILSIIAEESGERIDALLAHMVDGMSRSAAQRLIEQGAVLLDGRPVQKNTRCDAGTQITVVLPEAQDIPLRPQNLPLDVIYEDDDLIVVNKPRGMVVHPAPGHPDGTLVNALLWHCGDSLSGVGGERRPGIVHRIDKDTSGLLIVAKNDFAHQILSSQLADRSLSRVYEAVVRGRLRDDSGTIEITNTLNAVMSDPPVQKIVEGNPPTDDTFTFQMKAVTDGAPMPEGSKDGVKTVQITGNGSYEFGEMWFTEPGEWVYDISEINDGIKGYTYDTTVYNLTVTVTEGEDGKLVKEETVTANGGSAGDIVFTNVYEEEEPEPAPKTGDNAPTAMALLALLASGVALVLLRQRRKEEN